MTDGDTNTKTHTVGAVSITFVDPATDIMKGTADPLTCVYAGRVGEAEGSWVFADSSGAWAVDLSVADPPRGPIDITLGSVVGALQMDADDDFTFTHWAVPTTLPDPANLTLTKSVDNTGGGTALATAWTLSATGPVTSSGATGAAAVTNAAVPAGTYVLAESGGPTGYSAGAWGCTGGTLTGSSLVLAAGETASCSIKNTFIVQQVPTGGIYPTNTSCQTFLAGAPVLPRINYTVQKGKITQNIAPGVFFYFSKVTVTAGEVVTTSQSSSSGSALFVLNNGNARAWTANCLTKVVMAPSANGTIASYKFSTAGTYILQLQYQTKSIAATAAPVPANPTYSFDTNSVVNGTVQLVKQN